jgi:hypothetical protein
MKWNILRGIGGPAAGRDMKNAIILSLLVVIALLALDRPHHGEAQAMIQDTKAAWPGGMLFAPCPLQPRNFPRWKERRA